MYLITNFRRISYVIKIYIVLLLALLFIWTDVTFPICLHPRRSFCHMQLIPATLIRAKELYSIPFETLLKCIALCLQEVTCFYTVVSDEEQLCTFYETDVIIQNVTNHQTYGLLLKHYSVSISYFVSVL